MCMILGVRVAVHRVQASAGYPGRPFVAQVADAFVMTKGAHTRPWRFTTPDTALAKAKEEAGLLARRRKALLEAWCP